jgi:hypothetical protein
VQVQREFDRLHAEADALRARNAQLQSEKEALHAQWYDEHVGRWIKSNVRAEAAQDDVDD